MRRETEQVEKRDGTGKDHAVGIWVALAVTFPGVALVTAVTYRLLRRRWPDRALAWLLVILAAPAVVTVVMVTRYQDHWLGVIGALIRGNAPATEDLLVLAAWGLAAGPVLGALYWRVRQRTRERSPYSGEDERSRRQRAEERRVKVLTHAAQKTRHTGRNKVVRGAVRPLAVPLGDQLGPFVGRAGRGDLGGDWRRGQLVRVPLAGGELRHLVVLGGTGLGKTETTLGPIAEWAIKVGYQVIYLSAKEPPSVDKSAAPRLVALAEKHGRTAKVLIPSVSPFDPMRGSLTEVRDRLVRIEEWGDRYWQHCANLLVGLALELTATRGERITTLPDLVFSLVKTRLKDLVKGGDRRVQELVDALEDRALAGGLTRYASMALHLREWVGPPELGGWSYENADVICAELPTGSQPEAGSALLRMMIRDFGSYLVSETRRQLDERGWPRPVLFIVEEVGAVAGDPVIGREFVDLVERARSAGAKCVLSAQDPLGLGDERAMSAILSNASILTFRQGPQAAKVAEEAGTRRVDEGAALFDQDGQVTAQGSTRRQHAMKVNPQWLRELGAGECYLIHQGRYRYCVATMSAAGYGQPEGQAVDQVVRQLRAARTGEPLPGPMPGQVGQVSGQMPGQVGQVSGPVRTDRELPAPRDGQDQEVTEPPSSW